MTFGQALDFRQKKSVFKGIYYNLNQTAKSVEKAFRQALDFRQKKVHSRIL